MNLTSEQQAKRDEYIRRANLYQSGPRRGTFMALANKVLRDAIHGKPGTVKKTRKHKRG